MYKLPRKGGIWAFPAAEPRSLPSEHVFRPSGAGAREEPFLTCVSSETSQVSAGPWRHLEESWRPVPARAAGELAVSDLSLTACLVPFSSVSD